MNDGLEAPAGTAQMSVLEVAFPKLPVSVCLASVALW